MHEVVSCAALDCAEFSSIEIGESPSYSSMGKDRRQHMCSYLAKELYKVLQCSAFAGPHLSFFREQETPHL